MADYGIDLDGVLDWPVPERLATGTRNLANALARRLLTANGAMDDIGDPAPYLTMNLRDWLGARPSVSEIQGLNTQMGQILRQEDRVDTVTASATFANGDLSVRVDGSGAAGPFALILPVSAVSGASLQVLQ